MQYLVKPVFMFKNVVECFNKTEGEKKKKEHFYRECEWNILGIYFKFWPMKKRKLEYKYNYLNIFIFDYYSKIYILDN